MDATMTEYRWVDNEWMVIQYEKPYTNRGHYYWNDKTRESQETCVYCGEMNPWHWSLRGKKGIVAKRKADCKENRKVKEQPAGFLNGIFDKP